jgi:hypothetical protein
VVEHFFEEDNLPSGLRAALARGGGAIDFDTLKDLMAYSAERVRGHFETLIGPPRRLADQAAPPRAIDPEGRSS